MSAAARSRRSIVPLLVGAALVAAGRAAAAVHTIAAGDVQALIETASAARAGDVVELMPGLYQPTNTIGLNVQGSDGAAIVVRSGAGGRAVLDGGKLPADRDMLSIGGRHVHVEGLEIRGATNSGVSVWGGAHVRLADNDIHDCGLGGIYVGFDKFDVVSDVVIEHNRVHHNSLKNRGRAALGGWSAGIATQRVRGARIVGNVVHENYGEGIIFNLSFDGVASDNVVFDNYSAQLYLDNARNCRFEHNLVWNSGAEPYLRDIGGWVPAVGIQLGNEDYGGDRRASLDGNVIVRNVVIDGGWGLYYAGRKDDGGIARTLVAHNTFYRARRALVHVDEGAYDGFSITNNLFVQTGSAPIAQLNGAAAEGLAWHANGWSMAPPASAAGRGDVIGDPRLARPGGSSLVDYDLLAGSPALGRALPIEGFGIEVGADLGARQRGDRDPDLAIDPSGWPDRLGAISGGGGTGGSRPRPVEGGLGCGYPRAGATPSIPCVIVAALLLARRGRKVRERRR